jgi:hypothetical protein
MIIGLGAKYSRIVRASTTHLITTEREIDNEAKQGKSVRLVSFMILLAQRLFGGT